MSENTERLDAIQARMAAATTGPWEYNGHDVNQSYDLAVKTGENTYERVGIIPGEYVRSNDAEFIAAAPSDVAFLLDLARKQQAALDALSQWAGRAKTGYYDEAQDDVVQIIRPALWPTP